jgi:hypothetical protein
LHAHFQEPKKAPAVVANRYPIPITMVRYTGSQWVVPKSGQLAQQKAPANSPAVANPSGAGDLKAGGEQACQPERNIPDH